LLGLFDLKADLISIFVLLLVSWTHICCHFSRTEESLGYNIAVEQTDFRPYRLNFFQALVLLLARKLFLVDNFFQLARAVVTTISFDSFNHRNDLLSSCLALVVTAAIGRVFVFT
jgi:hypothetical protein